jgi:hypothetical protein
MPDFLRYYKEFLAHWGKELWSLGREQVVGLVLAGLIFMFQIRNGLVPAKDAELAAQVTFLRPYLALLGIYLAIHLVRTPWKLDQELREKLQRGTSQEEIKNHIELLTRLTDRGQEFIRRCRSERALVPPGEVEAWAQEVVGSVEEIFDSTYVTRLENLSGIPSGTAHWPNSGNRQVDGFVHVRVYRLRQFIDELQEHAKKMV